MNKGRIKLYIYREKKKEGTEGKQFQPTQEKEKGNNA